MTQMPPAETPPAALPGFRRFVGVRYGVGTMRKYGSGCSQPSG